MTVRNAFWSRIFNFFYRSYFLLHKQHFLRLAEWSLWNLLQLNSRPKSNTSTEEVIQVEGWADFSGRWASFRNSVIKLNPTQIVSTRRIWRTDLSAKNQLLGRELGFVLRFIYIDPHRPIVLPNFQFSNVDVDVASDNKHLEFIGYPELRSKNGYIDSVLGFRGYRSFAQKRMLFSKDLASKALELMKHLGKSTRRIEIARYFTSSTIKSSLSAKFALSIDYQWATNFVPSSFEIVKIEEIYEFEEVNSVVPSLSTPIHGYSTAYKHGAQVKTVALEPQQLFDVRVQAGGTVFNEKSLFVYENAANPKNLFVSGQWDHVFGFPDSEYALLAKFPENDVVIPAAILLSGRNDMNWYHWITEYLPRVALFAEIDMNIPFLISDELPKNFIDALRLITNRPTVAIPRSKCTAIEVLWVSPPVVQVMDSDFVPFDQGIALNIRPLLWLREEVLNTAIKRGPSKVFLSRMSNHRGLSNEAEIEIALKQLGFESIDIASLTFSEQISIFSSADIIVGAGGAVMANYLFCKPGARILALASQATEGFVLPAAIAQVADAKFAYSLGKTLKQPRSFNSRLEWMHSDFKVNVSQVMSSLRKIQGP